MLCKTKTLDDCETLKKIKICAAKNSHPPFYPTCAISNIIVQIYDRLSPLINGGWWKNSLVKYSENPGFFNSFHHLKYTKYLYQRGRNTKITSDRSIIFTNIYLR